MVSVHKIVSDYYDLDIHNLYLGESDRLFNGLLKILANNGIEIELADLKLKVVSNLSEAKNNRKLIFLKDTNGLEQSRRIKKYPEKLDLNLTLFLYCI